MKAQATKLYIHPVAYIARRNTSYAIIYISVNNRHYRVAKSKGQLPSVVTFNDAHQMLDDAKIIAKSNVNYELTTIQHHMPMSQQELLQLVLGLHRLNLIEIERGEINVA